MTDEIADAQDKYTYNPPQGSPGSRLLGAASVPLSLLAKGTEALGDKTLSATGSPLLATIADVGTNAAVTAGAGKLIGSALRPKTLAEIANPPATPVAPAARVEPTMSGAISPTAQSVPSIAEPPVASAQPPATSVASARSAIPTLADASPSSRRRFSSSRLRMGRQIRRSSLAMSRLTRYPFPENFPQGRLHKIRQWSPTR